MKVSRNVSCVKLLTKREMQESNQMKMLKKLKDEEPIIGNRQQQNEPMKQT